MTVELREETVGQHPHREIPFVVLEVSDTGVGMDTETRERMFETFFSTKGTQGRGLGMSIVNQIITMAGGFIQVDSYLGMARESACTCHALLESNKRLSVVLVRLARAVCARATDLTGGMFCTAPGVYGRSTGTPAANPSRLLHDRLMHASPSLMVAGGSWHYSSSDERPEATAWVEVGRKPAAS